MNNKKILIVVLLIIIAAAIIALICFNRTSSIFDVVNDENGNIAVTAQNSDKNASGMAYITLEEGQKLEVRANLTDNSLIKLEVLPKNIDATTKVLMEETFTSIDACEFELPSGEYSIRITAEKSSTGSMDIKAKNGVEEQGENKINRTNSI